MEANIKERIDLKANFNNEVWEIDFVWMDNYGRAVWYDGITFRDGVCFHRIFTPSEIAGKFIRETMVVIDNKHRSSVNPKTNRP